MTDLWSLLSLLEHLDPSDVFASRPDSVHSVAAPLFSAVFRRSLRLIVVDSFQALVAPLLCRGGAGQAAMMHLSQALRRLSRTGPAVVVTNTMVGMSVMNGGPNAGPKPALGEVWAFVPSLTLQMDRQDGGGHGGPQMVHYAWLRKSQFSRVAAAGEPREKAAFTVSPTGLQCLPQP